MSKSRAVAYIRVSTEKDAQLHSYDFQEHYWRSAFEDDPETELVGIYADKGISGHSIQKRPQFLMMMQDAREHKFDKIYTKSVSRFARNTTQLLEAVRALRDIGIEVIFEKENIHTFESTSEVFLTIAATIAENDLIVDSERMRWSVRHRYENGWISIGNGLYGLRLTADNNLVVVPEEAAVVRYIYDAYVNGGLGSKRISDALNASGITTRKGREWTCKNVLELIRNEKYKGDVLLGKTVRILGEYHDNKNGEYGPRYYIEDTHEPIVDKETWALAQKIMDGRGKNNPKHRPTYPFTGMIKCSCCGGNYMHKVNGSGLKWASDIWACLTYLRQGKKSCDNSRIKDTVLKEKFVSAYNEFIERRPQGDSMVALQEVLAELRQQERELAELMMQRLIPKAAYEEERASITAQIAGINEKIAERRLNRVPESEHTPITDFDADKVTRFLTKVIVSRNTVAFVFYNGAKIIRTYDNGPSGNRPGWNKRRMHNGPESSTNAAADVHHSGG